MIHRVLAATSLGVVLCSVLACGVADHDSTGDIDRNAAGDANASREDAKAPDGGSEAAACCPIDAELSGCMQLGGSAAGGCLPSCDFWCSENWRRSEDAAGCAIWEYDVRAPRSSETAQCQAQSDAGADADL